MVLDLLAEGLTPQRVITDHYPQITLDDIRACIAYGSAMSAAQSLLYQSPNHFEAEIALANYPFWSKYPGHLKKPFAGDGAWSLGVQSP